MSRTISTAFENAKRFPRVSGDEPKAMTDVKYADLFSPRERG